MIDTGIMTTGLDLDPKVALDGQASPDRILKGGGIFGPNIEFCRF